MRQSVVIHLSRWGGLYSVPSSSSSPICIMSVWGHRVPQQLLLKHGSIFTFFSLLFFLAEHNHGSQPSRLYNFPSNLISLGCPKRPWLLFRILPLLLLFFLHHQQVRFTFVVYRCYIHVPVLLIIYAPLLPRTPCLEWWQIYCFFLFFKKKKKGKEKKKFNSNFNW